MDAGIVEQNRLEDIPDFTAKAIQLLKDLKSIWLKLDSEPNGSWVNQNHLIFLPPSSSKYWVMLNTFNTILTDLYNEVNGKDKFDLTEFKISMNKEGQRIRDFKQEKGWSETTYRNKLSNLMKEFNERIQRDLFSLFLWFDAIDKNSK